MLALSPKPEDETMPYKRIVFLYLALAFLQVLMPPLLAAQQRDAEVLLQIGNT